MNTWGKSWGASWGSSWGEDAIIGSSIIGRVRLPARMVDAQRIRMIDEDDSLLLIAASLVVAYGTLETS